MQKVTEVHLIVHPTYVLYLTKNENLDLISRIMRFSEVHSRDPSNLFLLEANSDTHYENFFESLERLRSKHLVLTSVLMNKLKKECPHFVDSEDPLNKFYEGESALDNTMREQGLEFDLENLVLVGHGMYKEKHGGCIFKAINRIEKGMLKRYGKSVNCRVNDDTSLSGADVGRIFRERYTVHYRTGHLRI